MKKSKYTKQEIEELIQWFREHWGEVPKSMRIDEATNIPDLRETLTKLVECVKLNWYKPRMDGYVEMQLKIKRNMLGNIK